MRNAPADAIVAVPDQRGVSMAASGRGGACERRKWVAKDNEASEAVKKKWMLYTFLAGLSRYAFDGTPADHRRSLAG